MYKTIVTSVCIFLNIRAYISYSLNTWRTRLQRILTTLIGLSAIIWTANSWAVCTEIYDHKMRKLHSQEQVNICALIQDRPALIINTASHCGYTKQFKGLEDLHQQYKDQGLVVIGFASNDFNQEAKDEAKAADVCFVNYGVSFTMLAPSGVKGEQANPVFKGLAAQSKAPGWNFNKYLVNKSGEVVEHFGSSVKPEDAKLNKAIRSVLRD